jgi:hypothetical protein
VVLEDRTGVVKLVPVNILDPPVKVVYQFTVPEDAVAPRTTVPFPQRLLGVVDVIVGIALTVTEIPELVARTQGVTPDVNTTVTTNGLVPYGVKGIDEFVGIVKVFRELLDPTFSPLTCH